MIRIEQHGSFRNTERFLKKARRGEFYQGLDSLAQQGVLALANATPSDTGKTSQSWGYQINRTPEYVEIVFTNSNIVDGVPIAIIVQKGHGTGTGGYVSGRDYINPAIQPIFDDIADKVWKEVTR